MVLMLVLTIVVRAGVVVTPMVMPVALRAICSCVVVSVSRHGPTTHAKHDGDEKDDLDTAVHEGEANLSKSAVKMVCAISD